MITVTIDGKEIQAEKGKTILQIAQENGISIPTLCWYKNLFPIASCRLCIVEIEGYDKPVTSCDTVAVDGISVITQSDRLFSMRQEYLKFLLIHHPLDCPICDAGGECRLQDLVFAHKITAVDLTAEKQPLAAEPYATALIRYSKNRCVLCLRCVHACREVSGRSVLSLTGHGIDALMAPSNASNCISCGECLSVCPVGALTEQISPLKSRKWQTTRTATTCPHCGFGCQVTLDVYDNRIITKTLTDVDKKPNEGSLCVMGRFGYDFANHASRIAQPSIRENGGNRTCDLNEAVETTAAAFTRLIKEGKRSGFIVSPRATNEEINMVLQIASCFPMAVMGSSSYYHTGKALNILRQMGLVRNYDYDEITSCDFIVVAGADLLANNHLLANKIRNAVKRNGTRIAVIDPSPTSLTEIADVWLKPAPHTDAALLTGLAHYIIANKIYDADVVQISGFTEFATSLQSIDEKNALQHSGVNEKDFYKFCDLFSRAGSIAFIFGSGISSSDDGMAAFLNLSLLKCSNKKGLVIPTALQSNALGSMSILANPMPPHRILNDPGIGGLFIYEDNPFQYLPGDVVEDALKKKSFVTVCEGLPTEVCDYATVTVPTGTFAEKHGTSVAQDGFVRRIERARGNHSPGFEFLKLLLNKLCGGLYHSEDEALAGLFKKGVLTTGEDNKDGLTVQATEARFLPIDPPSSASPPHNPYTLVLRNTFLDHHLAGKDVYAKLVYLNNPSIAGDKLFISPEDASELGISDGDMITLKSGTGSTREKVSIKKGLKKGLLEYRMLRKRQHVLNLSGEYVKHIPITVEKG